jgi:hypothetical protein
VNKTKSNSKENRRDLCVGFVNKQGKDLAVLRRKQAHRLVIIPDNPKVNCSANQYSKCNQKNLELELKKI